jgi:hypothetical protein
LNDMRMCICIRSSRWRPGERRVVRRRGRRSVDVPGGLDGRRHLCTFRAGRAPAVSCSGRGDVVVLGAVVQHGHGRRGGGGGGGGRRRRARTGKPRRRGVGGADEARRGVHGLAAVAHGVGGAVGSGGRSQSCSALFERVVVVVTAAHPLLLLLLLLLLERLLFERGGRPRRRTRGRPRGRPRRGGGGGGGGGGRARSAAGASGREQRRTSGSLGHFKILF